MQHESVAWEAGGEGGIRTHVPVLPDHPISSRRRYDRFGTSPVSLRSRRRQERPRIGPRKCLYNLKK